MGVTEEVVTSTSSTWCASLSGNGGNWASTVGFLAESLRIFLQDKGDNELLDLRCVTGGSSGSAATLLVMQLMMNEEFGIPDSGLATKAQAHYIASSMSLLAQAFDLTRREKLDAVGKLAAVKLERWNTTHWGKAGVAVGVEGNILMFKRGLVLARYMRKDWLNIKVKDIIADHCGVFGKAFKHCSHLSRTALQDTAHQFKLELASDSPEGEATEDRHKEQLEVIGRDIADGVKRKMNTGVPIKEFRVMMQVDPLDGFIVTTFVTPEDPGKPAGIEYGNLRVLALMSRTTASRILSSGTYRQKLAACSSKGSVHTECAHADRYLIGVVEDLDTMLRLSTMEPGFQEYVADHFSNLGVVAFFDPAKTKANFSELLLTEVSTDTDPLYGILGGFVDRGHSVSMLEYFQDGMHKLERAEFTLFGKSEPPRTAVNAVKEICTYTGTEEEQNAAKEANWADYSAWADHRPHTPSSVYCDGSLDWDCGASIPANLAGRSWMLRWHGVARARLAAEKPTEHPFDLMEGCEEGVKVLAKNGGTEDTLDDEHDDQTELPVA